MKRIEAQREATQTKAAIDLEELQAKTNNDEIAKIVVVTTICPTPIMVTVFHFSINASSSTSNPAMKTISLLLGSMPRNGEGALPSFDTSNAFLRGDAELFRRIFDKRIRNILNIFSDVFTVFLNVQESITSA